MSKKSYYLLLVIAAFSTIIACKKKSDDPAPTAPTPTTPTTPTTQDNNVTLHANDGNVYFAEGNNSSQVAAKAQLTTTNLTISGAGFDLSVDTIAGIIGTYNITPTDPKKYIEITTSSNTWVSYQSSGKIVITSIDRINQTISGYFTATMLSSAGTATFSGDFKNIIYIGKSYMTGVVNGTNWASPSPYYGVKNGQVNITGSGNGTPIFLNLKNITGPGTYTISLDGNYRATHYTSNFVQYLATSGEIVVSHYDVVNKIIKGTFSFTAPQVPDTGFGTGPSTITVTNGQFNIQKYSDL